jgi:hypothetical protein
MNIIFEGDIRVTDEELKALVAGLAVAQAKTDEELRALTALQAKMSEELKALATSTAASQAETARLIRELREGQKLTDAQLAKTDAQLAKTDAGMRRLQKLFGNHVNNQGKMAEDFFYRSLKQHPQIGDLKFDFVNRNVKNCFGKLAEEYDLVLVNSISLIIIEVKAKAHVADLEVMVNRKVPNFSRLFPQFQGYQIYAGIATLATYDELLASAEALGLFLITQEGKHTALIQAGKIQNVDR